MHSLSKGIKNILKEPICLVQECHFFGSLFTWWSHYISSSQRVLWWLLDILNTLSRSKYIYNNNKTVFSFLFKLNNFINYLKCHWSFSLYFPFYPWAHPMLFLLFVCLPWLWKLSFLKVPFGSSTYLLFLCWYFFTFSICLKSSCNFLLKCLCNCFKILVR